MTHTLFCRDYLFSSQAPPLSLSHICPKCSLERTSTLWHKYNSTSSCSPSLFVFEHKKSANVYITIRKLTFLEGYVEFWVKARSSRMTQLLVAGLVLSWALILYFAQKKKNPRNSIFHTSECCALCREHLWCSSDSCSTHIKRHPPGQALVEKSECANKRKRVAEQSSWCGVALSRFNMC